MAQHIIQLPKGTWEIEVPPGAKLTVSKINHQFRSREYWDHHNEDHVRVKGPLILKRVEKQERRLKAVRAGNKSHFE